MSKPTLSYFDFAGSRGEECRIALHVAGVEFVDNRVKRDQWLAMKASSPFGSMPILEIPGKPPLAQSNAILRFIGHKHDLHPTDAFEAARHDALMNYCEELRGHVTPILRISDETERLAARAKLATEYLPQWGNFVDKHLALSSGPFVSGDKLNVADIKLYIIVRWFASGGVDHVPPDVFERSERLTRLYQAVGAHPRVSSWLNRAT